MTERRPPKRLKELLLWVLLGPVTGFLVEGVIRNWRAGEANLAALYAIALSLISFDLFKLSGRMLGIQ